MRSPPEIPCAGRDALCAELAECSLSHGLTLFFGGPKAGKLTVLERLVDYWPSSAGASKTLARVPVLLDLRNEREITSDLAFYKLALAKLRRELPSCQRGVVLPAILPESTDDTPCHWFFEQVRALVAANSMTDFHILIVVHRFDYLLSNSFSEVFERNLVGHFKNSASVQGRGIGGASRLGFILSGPAKIFAQSRNPDSHSSLRGIRQRRFCLNLTIAECAALVALLAGKKAPPAWVQAVAERVSSATGGQCALACRMAQALVSRKPCAGGKLDCAVEEVRIGMREEATGLLQLASEDLRICGGYSEVAIRALHTLATLAEPAMRAALAEAGMEETLWQHAMESVAMCGFAHYDRFEGTLTRCNEFFWPALDSATQRSPQSGVLSCPDQDKRGNTSKQRAPKPVPAAQKNYVFVRAARKYLLYLNGEPEEVLESLDLRYLFVFLQKPNVWFTWLELVQACQPGAKVDGTPEIRKSLSDAASAALRRLRNSHLKSAPQFLRYFNGKFEENSRGGRGVESTRRYTGEPWTKSGE
ncbi:MAG: hypothetical protein QOD99_979 [Chthoniobacter sp.]|nr:hypothetical protein [Chthoniobacter sp.]